MVSSFLSAAFVFRSDEGKAGETCQSQLSIKSDAFVGSSPVVLKGVRIAFEGSLRTVLLSHEASDKPEQARGNILMSKVALREEPTAGPDSSGDDPADLRGACDLTIIPGQTNVYEMAIPLREAGEAKALCVAMVVQTDKFVVDYTVNFQESSSPDVWFGPSTRRKVARLDAHTIKVQPRPPKMEIRLKQVAAQYYANEHIELQVEIRNDEDSAASTRLEVTVLGEPPPKFSVKVNGGDAKAAAPGEDKAEVSGLSIGTVGSSKATLAMVSFDPALTPTVYDITIRALYSLVADPATPITQVMAFQLNIVNPFEANYDLVPRLHPDTWPSLFDPESLQDVPEGDGTAIQPRGLAQKWCLLCHFASFAHEDLVIVDADAKVLSCTGGARCTTTKRSVWPDGGTRIPPKTMQEAQFDLEAQKFSLDDRGPASLDVAFVLKWRRFSSTSPTVNTTVMLVPRYIVLGTEPRVLASVSYANDHTGLVHLDITIENASNHFLTFGLSMEPSDEFAFSGAKQTTVHVVPMSRRAVNYRLLPLIRGAYVRPALVVRDKYFQKVLRIIPTEGMKIDKDGLLVWIPPLEEPESEDEEGQANA
jgi:trafficking protein particle complex subunit 11